MAFVDYTVNFFITHSELAIYITICLLLFLGGLGFPIPEDPILVAAGYVAFDGYTNLYLTIPVAIIGALIGDLTVYFIGRNFGEEFLKLKYVRPVFSKKRLIKIRDYFKRHGAKTIFFARFVVGLRNPVYLVAGTMKIRLSRFIAIDSLGALISVPIFVCFGFIFGEHIKTLIMLINRTKYSALLLFIVFCVLYFAYKKMKPRKQNNKGSLS